MESNDNEVGRINAVPARHVEYGHAAILLVESLIHGLIERAILSVEDAIEIVDVAYDAKMEIGLESEESDVTMMTSLALLQSISASLEYDRPARGDRSDADRNLP